MANEFIYKDGTSPRLLPLQTFTTSPNTESGHTLWKRFANEICLREAGAGPLRGEEEEFPHGVTWSAVGKGNVGAGRS